MEVDLNLGWAVAWKGVVSAFVLGGGGLALCVVCLSGLPEQDLSLRVAGVVVGLVLLLVGVGALFGLRKYALRARIGDDGLVVRRRDGELRLRWDEVRRIGLDVEKRWMGRTRYRHYTLTFELAEDRPDLATWREDGGYRYDLGQAGHAGRRLDRELGRAGTRYTGMREASD